MEVIRTIKEMRQLARQWNRSGQAVSFVPTMGALHRGHGKLFEKGKEYADVTVASIFVNPMQFDDEDDFRRYPRDLDKDKAFAEKHGVDYLFVPEKEEMYPPGFLTTVNVSFLSTRLEGEVRPGHFRGVCTIVLKLLNIIQPTFLVLGLKDAQQYTILTHMVYDLGLEVKVIGVPTVREPDGLALSSRNVLLSKEQRELALCMSRALKRVHFLVKKQKIQHSGELLKAVRSTINIPGVQVDYASIVNRTTLEPMEHVFQGASYVLLAIRVGDVRLIDNTRI